MVSWLTDLNYLKSNHTVLLVGLVRWRERMAEGDVSTGRNGVGLALQQLCRLRSTPASLLVLTHARSPSPLQTPQGAGTGARELTGNCTLFHKVKSCALQAPTAPAFRLGKIPARSNSALFIKYTLSHTVLERIKWKGMGFISQQPKNVRGKISTVKLA